MSLFGKPGCPLRLSLALLFLASLMLFFYAQPGLGGLGPCEMLRKELASTRVRYYLGRETDLDLLEPVALALQPVFVIIWGERRISIYWSRWHWRFCVKNLRRS